MDKALEQLVEAVKQASPALWAAAQHKVQADIAAQHFWEVFFIWSAAIAAVLAITIFATAMLTDGLDDGFAGVFLFFLFVAVVAGALATVNHVDVVRMRAAPDWYAVKAIAELSPLK